GALRARRLARHAAFSSVGANVRAQRTCAAGRGGGGLGRVRPSGQRAVLGLVAPTAREAEAAGRPCGVCGEAAADPLLACVLVGMGVTTLSMGATALPMVRAALARATREQCRRAAEAALEARGPSEARAAARTALPGLAELGL